MHISQPNTKLTWARGRCPLATPKILYVYIFYRKGTEIVRLWFPKIHNLLRKEVLPPLWPLKILYFCKFIPKRAWIYAYLARRIQNFLGKGALPLATPARGPPPWTPLIASHKRSVCSLRLQLFEHPPMLKIFIHCKNSGVKLTSDWIQYRSNLEWCQFNTMAVLF